jgi:PKD repeat protein
MKNLRILLAFAILVSSALFISAGCKKTSKTPAPVANFTFVSDNNSSPTVSFTNLTTDATSYNWDFGDGYYSTDQNPQHTYSTSGYYSVQLSASGAGGSNSITKSVVLTDVTFNNPVYTDIYVTINGTTQTVFAGSSNTFYALTGNSVSYNAYTYGETSTGTQIGLKMVWNYTIDLSGDPVSYTLDVSSDYFFLYLTNTGTHVLTPIYVNYGLASQTVDHILIPDDGTEYSTGYYLAYSNTVVRAYWQDQPNTYTYWQNINFPGTDDQYISLTNTHEMFANIDETPQSPGTPQLLKPSAPPKLKTHFNKKAIKVLCK